MIAEKDEVMELARLALKRPDSFMMWDDEGKEWWTLWGLCGPSRHRDSHALDRSNYEVIYNDLKSRFPNQIDEFHSSHWAVGWIDQIACQVLTKKGKPTKAFLALLEWKDRLESYPIADEMHYSEMEYNEFSSWIEDEFGAENVSEVSEILSDMGCSIPDDVCWDDIKEIHYAIETRDGWYD